MPTLAFATCAARPAVTPDDALVAAHLAAGFEVAGVPWDAPDRDWRRFEAVVLRSTWDYHLRRDEFEGWLDRLDAAGVAVWNPTALVRWNLDKTYLRDLAAAGVETVPTVWLSRGAEAELAAILAARGWERAVLKPTVGASGFGLRVVGAGGAARHQGALEEALDRGGAMIQPLLTEVESDGEWSLVFLGGEASHAVRKRARAGEVRVQSDYGGSVEAASPPPALWRWAEACLDRCRRPGPPAAAAAPLYARVDAVRTAAGPRLMELELIEPQLFLATDSGAARRFARALSGASRRR